MIVEVDEPTGNDVPTIDLGVAKRIDELLALLGKDKSEKSKDDSSKEDKSKKDKKKDKSEKSTDEDSIAEGVVLGSTCY